MSPIPLDNENQAIAHTLNQIYNSPSQVRENATLRFSVVNKNNSLGGQFLKFLPKYLEK